MTREDFQFYDFFEKKKIEEKENENEKKNENEMSQLLKTQRKKFG